MTRGPRDRLNRYDVAIPPAPVPKPAKAKGYADCRFFKEEDERLACFNGFAEHSEAAEDLRPGRCVLSRRSD